MAKFKRPDGLECSAYYVEPAAGKTAPAVVVIQEWWGLNDQIKAVAERLRSEGYRALVPDLYRGKIGLDAKEAEHLMTNLDFGDAAAQDIRGAVQLLKETSPKVAVMGFCMGGALTLLAAAAAPEMDAAVVWYGCPPLDYLDATKIKAPVQGHWATDDAFFPLELVAGLEQKFKDAGVDYEFHRYNAQHAFANETLKDQPIPIAHDAASAAQAWSRTLSFLKDRLAP